MIMPYPIFIPIHDNTDICIDLKIFKYFPLIINIILLFVLFYFAVKSYYHINNYILLNENTIHKNIEKILFNKYIVLSIIMIITIIIVNVIFHTTLYYIQ